MAAAVSAVCWQSSRVGPSTSTAGRASPAPSATAANVEAIAAPRFDAMRAADGGGDEVERLRAEVARLRAAGGR